MRAAKEGNFFFVSNGSDVTCVRARSEKREEVEARR
jgi:hypothetical protein